MNKKSEPDIKHILQTYGDMLYRTAYLLLGNPHDVQDVLQEVLLRYMEKSPAFLSSNHEKAWLLRVTSNCCKDCLRFCKRHTYIDLEQIQEYLPAPEEKQLIRELYALPAKWKTVLILYYFEGYKLKEISQITGENISTIKSRHARGLAHLRQLLITARTERQLEEDETMEDALKKEISI